MASLGDLTVELELDSDDFTRNMERMQSRINTAGQSISRQATRSFGNVSNVLSSVGGSLGSVGNLLAGGLATGGAMLAIEGLASAFSTLGNAIKNTVTEGIKYNASMEANTIAFEVMLGSMEDAKNMMADISKFAEVTPFATSDLVQGAKVMKAFGIETEKLMPNLKMIGDVALGDSEKMKSLVLAFSQVSAGGKLTGGDLLQFINAGFNPLQIIAEKTGKSMSDLKDTMSDGGISAELVAKAFQSATSEGGRFFQGMDKLGQSFEGRMSTLEDTMTILKGKLTKPFFDFLSSKVLPKIQVHLDNLVANLPKLMQQFSQVFNSEIKPILIKVWGILKDLFSEGTQTAKSFMGALKLIMPILNYMWQSFKVTFMNIIDIIGTVRSVVNDLIQIFYDAFGYIYAFITGNMEQATEISTRMWNNFKSAFGKIWQLIGKMVLNVMDGINGVLKGFGINVKEIFNKVASVITTIINKVLDYYDEVVSLLNLLPNVEISVSTMRFNPYFDYGGNMLEGIKDFFNLNDVIDENNKLMGENIEVKKEAVDWQAEFNSLLEDGSKEGKELEKALEKLSDKLLSTAQAFANFVDIFDKVKKVRISATSVFRRLQGQVLEMRRWKDALQNIGERVGENSALFQELASKGPAAAGQILAVSRLSDQQMEEYKSLFGEKQAIGMEVAGIQQAGAMGLTSKQIQINISGNNINDSMDLDIIANRLAKELTIAGVN